MRVHQLARMIEPFLPSHLKLELSAIKIPHKWIRNRYTTAQAVRKWAQEASPETFFFVSKACIKYFIEEIIEILHSKNCTISFDHVDSDFSLGPQGAPDFHICTSITQLNFIKQHQEKNPQFKGEPKLLLHNYDIKLLNSKTPQKKKFKCAYVGTPSVGYLPQPILGEIEIVSAMGVNGMQKIIERLPAFNAHYALRLPQPTSSLLAKPFTKGFVAAACGAVVVTDRTTHDAEYLLGTDYPYMVNSLDLRDTLEMIEFMKNTFGAKEWKEAERRMSELKDMVSPQKLAHQLTSIIRQNV